MSRSSDPPGGPRAGSRPGPRPMGPRWLGLCALLAAGCGDAEPPSPDEPPGQGGAAPETRAWPEGTVLAVDDVPITLAEVDPVADAIAEVYPEYTRAHARRLALTNVVLPRAAAANRFPDARAAMLEVARQRLADLASGSEETGAIEISGRFGQLDLDLWLVARTLEPGAWGGPFDLVGRWSLVRLDEIEIPDGIVEAALYRLSVIRFPYAGRAEEHYLDAGEAIEAAIDASRLEFVDPAWRNVLPEAWKRRMKGSGGS